MGCRSPRLRPRSLTMMCCWPCLTARLTHSSQTTMGTLTIRASDSVIEFNTTMADVSHLDRSASHENVDRVLVDLECWMSLLADSPLNRTTGCRKPARVFAKFYREFLAGPLLDVIKRYSSLADQLMNSAEFLGDGSVTRAFLPVFLDTPIAKEYLCWYKDDTADVLAYMLSFLLFSKKIDYVDQDFDATALRGWLAVENRLSALTLDLDVMRGLRHVMKTLLPDSSDQPVFGRFGPGRVAERGVFGRISKSNNLGYDRKLERLLFTGLNASFGLRAELGYSPDRVLPDAALWYGDKRVVSQDYSRLKFVPKDVTKSRTICMEPNSYMWAQQLCLPLFLEAISAGPAAAFIDVSDQSINRDLSRFGSLTGMIDTIDLSSASDSVSWKLARYIFPGRFKLMMAATRTSRVEMPDGSIRQVEKFAPMGSALCFIVQCLIFTSVCILSAINETYSTTDARVTGDIYESIDVKRFIARRFAGLSGPKGQRVCHPMWYQYHALSVYGDDICVDTRLTAETCKLLSILGFEVNHSKSFKGRNPFRESCGGYYYRGEDVTPLRLRLRDFSKVLSAKALHSVVALINSAGDRRYTHLRSRLIWEVLVNRRLSGNIHQFGGRNPIPFSREVDVAGLVIFTDRAGPINAHLRSRAGEVVDPGVKIAKKDTHLRYQRDEQYQILGAADESQDARDFEVPALEAYLYQRWFADRVGGVITGAVQKAPFLRYDSSGSRLVGRWMPRRD